MHTYEQWRRHYDMPDTEGSRREYAEYCDALETLQAITEWDSNHQERDHPGFEEEERYHATSFYVADDLDLPNGTRILGNPLTPRFATPDQASAALEQLRRWHPNAYVIQSVVYCVTSREHQAQMADVVQMGEGE